MAGSLADVLPIEILPEIDRQELAGHMTMRKFKQDEVVYHQGDPAAHWFVVFEGLAKVLLLDENGRELLISLHSRGEFFGELVIFEEKVPEGWVSSVELCDSSSLPYKIGRSFWMDPAPKTPGLPDSSAG